jgi:DNA replication protein DnaC
MDDPTPARNRKRWIPPSLDLRRNVAPVHYSTPTIGELTVADAILDRLLHHSFKIELKGESIRKIKK